MTDKTAWEGHTPLPWRLSRISETTLQTDDGRTTATCGGYYDNSPEANWHTENNANAALIVHCVNNFPALEAERDALREACEKALDHRYGEWPEILRQALAISEKSE